MTTPKINPLTGHEDSLPNPRPRNEILKELLASYQVDPNKHLYDIYYQLQLVMSDLQTLVDKEQTEFQPARRRKHTLK